MDLRGHGISYQNQKQEQENNNNLDNGASFRDCARDIEYTLNEFHTTESNAWKAPTSVVVGHSFGGRVALEYASMTPLKAVWLLDTVPGRANESVDRVLVTISHVLSNQSNNGKSSLTRKEMTDILTQKP